MAWNHSSPGSATTRRERRPYLVALAAGLLLLLTAAGAASATHYALPGQSDVSDEPSTAADSGRPVDGAGPANGFSDLADGRQDLVLDGNAVPLATIPADHNAVLRQATAEAGQSWSPAMLPGVVDFEVYWGWWQDKGSGGYWQEAGSAGAAFAGPPDGVIDDGDDNHADDVAFSEADECPPADPTCWQTTGSWDEFIWRGPNQPLADDRVQYVAQPDDGEGPITNVSTDEMFLFVHPGTHGNWVQHQGQEDTGNPLPGYGIISQGADHVQAYDQTCRYEAQSTWECGRFGATYDRSLLITTTVRIAVNPAGTTNALQKDYTDPSTTAVDTDVYTAAGPVETLYRTAVWDPGDQQHPPAEEGTPYPDNGLKGRLKALYSEDIPTILDQISEVRQSAIEPAEPILGLVDDLATAQGLPEAGSNEVLGGPPEPHEPHSPGDSFPGAVRNSGAEYNPQSNGDYYVPTQDWSQYGKSEHLWADFNADYGYVTPVIVYSNQGGSGVNADAVGGDRSEQDTHGPGYLSIFARVGTWLDDNQDTWIGNVDAEGRRTSSDEPYGEGTVEDPNDYSDHPGNPSTTANEWRGTCNANVEATLLPDTEPAGDVSGPEGRPDGTVDEYDRPWGTTNPPVGVYRWTQFGLLNSFAPIPDFTGDVGAGGAQILDDSDDERLSRYIQYGPVKFSLGGDCDQPKAGQFFPSEYLIFPTGTASYGVELTGVAALQENSKREPRGGTYDLTAEEVTDVDKIHQWT